MIVFPLIRSVGSLSTGHPARAQARWGSRLVARRGASCERWPGIPITLRQGARVIEDSRRLRVV
jgi:hypothetical protein